MEEDLRANLDQVGELCFCTMKYEFFIKDESDVIAHPDLVYKIYTKSKKESDSYLLDITEKIARTSCDEDRSSAKRICRDIL